jgi:hypothetical protein
LNIWGLAVFAFILLAAGAASPAAAQAVTFPPNSLNDEAIYKASISALTQLLVMAVLLESAFALIFSWRVFRTYFSLNGTRTVVMVAVSIATVWTFPYLDLVARLMAAFQGQAQSSIWVSQLITALILAGGSSGVNNVMRALGYRSAAADEAPKQVAPRGKAWIAVHVRRDKAVGPVLITVRRTDDRATDPRAPAPIAGSIGFDRPGILELLLQNPNRFPRSGGYELLADQIYEIGISARGPEGEIADPLKGQKFAFADGAIVDLRYTI